MNGEARPCAALRLFCIARFLARCLLLDLPVLRSVYFFAQGMYLHLTQGEFLGRAAPRQDNGGLC